MLDKKMLYILGVVWIVVDICFALFTETKSSGMLIQAGVIFVGLGMCVKKD